MKYHINFTKLAIKQLVKFKEPDYSRIKSAINELSENPRPRGSKKLIDSNSYRIRVGDYRIIYDIIDKKLVINIITLGHRKEIYK